MKEGPSDEWITVAKVKPFDNSYKATNLKDGVEYTFAVAAENSIGLGDECQLESAVVPKKTAGKIIIYNNKPFLICLHLPNPTMEVIVFVSF
jgi:hypothetical protein